MYTVTAEVLDESGFTSFTGILIPISRANRVKKLKKPTQPYLFFKSHNNLSLEGLIVTQEHYHYSVFSRL